MHKISVIIPVYNGEKYLREAIQCVLNQTWAIHQLIIINDGSTDGTERLISEYPSITYKSIKNSGPSTARNIGIELATGDYLAFLDADDLWPTNKLRRQISIFEENKEASMVIGHVQYMLLDATNPTKFNKLGIPVTGANLGACLYKKAAFDEVGLFNSNLRASEDLEWLIRARKMKVKSVIDSEVGLFYRLHASNSVSDIHNRNIHMLTVIKKSIHSLKPGLPPL